MKSLLELLVALFHDGSVCCTTAERCKDIQYLQHRAKHEGLSFLTITLPQFCDDFDKSLDQGFISPTDFRSFRSSARLPAFMRGYVRCVFSSNTGKLLDNPDTFAIQFVRQVTRLAKKIRIECSPERTRAAYQKYEEIENELATAHIDPVRASVLDRVSWSGTGVMYHTSQLIEKMTLTPKHGPGAVAIPSTYNAKFRLSTWSDRLQQMFPYDQYALANANALDQLDSVVFHGPGAEPPVRVVSVPKTLKTPRIIAIEPVHTQYVQQGIMEILYREIEKDHILGGHVNFTDQSINQQLAKVGSIRGDLATIDLSEASDRVSLDLVKILFGKYPDLYRGILACRSTSAKLPTRDEPIVLKKFASMGSALCFPIESLCFFYISICALLEARALSVTSRNIVKCARDVYVYGDDIIVPVHEVDAVILWLEAFSLKVNTKKSFWTGKFRESCGADWYDGVNVTPVYVRELVPNNRRDSKGLISTVSLANQLFRKGYWNAANYVRSSVERAVGFTLPIAQDECSGLAWETFLPSSFGGYKERWDPHLCYTQVRTLVPRVPLRNDELDDYPALLKFFLKRGREPFQQDDHLKRTVLRGQVTTNVRWVSLA